MRSVIAVSRIFREVDRDLRRLAINDERTGGCRGARSGHEEKRLRRCDRTAG